MLLLAAHHLVCDGYSFGIVLRDLARAMRGEPLTSSAYADYAADEARFSQSAEAGANVHFWTGRYAKDVPVTDLPTDHSRPARRQVAANRIDHLIPAADFERLQQAARSLRISLFSLLRRPMKTYFVLVKQKIQKKWYMIMTMKQSKIKPSDLRKHPMIMKRY